MRILYVNAIETNAGWGAEEFVNDGFLANGHQTFTVDYRKHRRQLSARFREADDFDALLLQRGEGFPLPLLASVRRPRVFWASELFARRPDQYPLFRSGLLEHAFVRTLACKRSVVERGWMRADQVSILLSGFSEKSHRRLEGVEQDIDVLFVGSMLPRRAAILDRLAGRFNVVVRRAFADEMVHLFNRAKVVLNIHAEDEIDTETRVFEALGCGSCLVTEQLSVDSPFRSGEHLIEASGIDAMEAAIARCLEDERYRRSVADAGHLEAVEHHSYRARATQIAEVMTRLIDAAQPTAGASPLDADRFQAFGRRELGLWASWQVRSLGRRGLAKLRRVAAWSPRG